MTFLEKQFCFWSNILEHLFMIKHNSSIFIIYLPKSEKYDCESV